MLEQNRGAGQEREDAFEAEGSCHADAQIIAKTRQRKQGNQRQDEAEATATRSRRTSPARIKDARGRAKPGCDGPLEPASAVNVLS